METEHISRGRRLASRVYDAGAGGRSPILDGPWWLAALGLIVVSVLVFGSSPWTWLVLPAVVVFFWLPFFVRWGVALRRSFVAAREGFRS